MSAEVLRESAVLLIPAPCLTRHSLAPYVPLGLCSLQAVAARLGLRVDVLHYPDVFPRSTPIISSERFAAEVAGAVDLERYRVVGLSTMCSSFHHSLNLARSLHARDPGVRLWMGGPHASVHPQSLLEAYPWIEAVFVGEGEGSFAAALARVSGHGAPPGTGALQGIPGVCTRTSYSEPGELLSDLDALPYLDEGPAYLTAFAALSPHRRQRGLPLDAERGCPGRCTFCSTSRFWGRRARRKSGTRLCEEMDRLAARTGSNRFSLMGDNFGHPAGALLDFCRAQARRGAVHEWVCSLTLAGLRAADLDTLWEGGCRGFFVGLESGSQATLDRIGKKLDLGLAIPLLELAIDRDFEVSLSFIVGFPWETREACLETYRLHVALLRRGAWSSDIVALSPHPGTDIEREYRAAVQVGEGLSASAFDSVRYGPETKSLIERCPELFTQFDYIPTGSPREEVAAIVMAAQLLNTQSGKRSV